MVKKAVSSLNQITAIIFSAKKKPINGNGQSKRICPHCRNTMSESNNVCPHCQGFRNGYSG